MADPILESFAQRVYDEVSVVQPDDSDTGYALANFVAAVGQAFQIIEDWSRDTDDGVGWSQMLDVDRAPSYALGWLAQFIGVTLQPDLDDLSQRARIKETDGWQRGSPSAIAGAAHQYLTGGKHVIIRERDPAVVPVDPAYGLTVITYTDETPDPDKVLAALLAQKPAGIVLNYETLSGQDFQALLDNHPTFQDVYVDYATFEGVATDTPGS